MGIVLKMYAGEARDFYPPMQGLALYYSDGQGRPATYSECNMQDEPEFSPNTQAIYPEYLTDWATLTCPSAPDYGDTAIINDTDNSGNPCPYAGFADNPSDSYLYFGWVIDGADFGDATTVISGVTLPFQMALAQTTLTLAGAPSTPASPPTPSAH